MNVEKHFKDIWSGVITGELWASSNVKHKFFLMFEKHVWGRLLMVLKDLFQDNEIEVARYGSSTWIFHAWHPRSVIE